MAPSLLSLKSLPTCRLAVAGRRRRRRRRLPITAAAAVTVSSLPENTVAIASRACDRQHSNSRVNHLAVIRDFARAQHEQRFQAPSAVPLFVAAGIERKTASPRRNREEIARIANVRPRFRRH
ncbi:hypothetical protein TIFTF001_049567 [Ficus carica]|uniref:Uncharacterized protein n=1 Tax=Ficus carica TaxID=3494 RepID=A0AA87Z6S5_FICCA|nr:hypothetical protein TIFTF001_049567 [Ficus carica]